MADVPFLILGKTATDAERAAANGIRGNLHSLDTYVRTFQACVALFDHAIAIEPPYSRETANLPVRLWPAIAARDGAMMIYHFGKVRKIIPELVRKCPPIMEVVDTKDLKANGASFETGFLGWAAMRKSVAHLGDFGKDEANIKSHQTIDSVTLPSFVSRGGHYASNCMDGRVYYASVDGKHVEYELSSRTAERLASVRDELFAIFQSAAEIIRSRDIERILGSAWRPASN